MKITKLQISDYVYTSNTITIEFKGDINFNKAIPELIKVLEEHEDKSNN